MFGQHVEIYYVYLHYFHSHVIISVMHMATGSMNRVIVSCDHWRQMHACMHDTMHGVPPTRIPPGVLLDGCTQLEGS